jgi:NTE family protein
VTTAPGVARAAPGVFHHAAGDVSESGERRRGIAICLSGGGYRAVLFHLGALRRLVELGIFAHPELRTISAVSGGSVVAALLAHAIGTHPEWAASFGSSVAEPVRRLTATNVRTPAILSRLLPHRWFDTSAGVKALARQLEPWMPSTLAELPARPRVVFCATDMSFGVNWIFERERMGDWRAGYVRPFPGEWPVARAVAASACFPPVFNPMPIRFGADRLSGGAAREEDEDTWREAVSDLRLTDGGTYDNLALEPVWRDHDVVLCSDAGPLFGVASDRNLLWRLGRYVAIVEAQARSLRRRWLVAGYVKGELRGAYWGVGGARSRYAASDRAGYSKRFAKEVLATVRTDFDAFTETEAAVLENHGYWLADRAIATHAPFLAAEDAQPLRVPHPELAPPRATEATLRAALAGSRRRGVLGRFRP